MRAGVAIVAWHMSAWGTKRLFTSLSREGPRPGGKAAIELAKNQDFEGPESAT